jgi:mono/diheme cytochrome c family protein
MHRMPAKADLAPLNSQCSKAMVKILKWSFITLVVLIFIGGSFFTYGMMKGGDRIAKKYDLTPPEFVISRDSASLARGEHLVNTLCRECHGGDLGGMNIFDDPALATIHSPNITKGKGGIGHYTDLDWVRALRHGVAPDGRALFVMPSKNFAHLCREDLGAVIAYMQQVEVVDRTSATTTVQPLGKFLLDLGAFGDIINAETIDHSADIPTAPDWSNSLAHGDYLVKIGGCRSCHGKELNGGKPSNPDAPPGPNITAGGNLGNWTADQFIRTMRSGITPEEHMMAPEFMPWKEFGQFDENEIKAVYEYLISLGELPDAKI